MPKGKGMLGKGAISQALKADIESSEAVSPTKNKITKPQKKNLDAKEIPSSKMAHQSVGEIERISITIDKDMLRKIDMYVFNQKQSDKSANRSRFITEAIASAVSKL